VDNLRVLCDAHNKLAARVAYGERWMGRYLRLGGPGEEAGPARWPGS